MSTTIQAVFATRRAADLALEHLVQEHGFERTDIFVEPVSDANSSGELQAGADLESGLSGVETRGTPALEGAIKVSVDVNDDREELARATLTDVGGTLSEG